MRLRYCPSPKQQELQPTKMRTRFLPHQANLWRSTLLGFLVSYSVVETFPGVQLFSNEATDRVAERITEHGGIWWSVLYA
jgi:hypothetical protein